MPISREGMLEYNEGSITGMGYPVSKILSFAGENSSVNWLLRA